MRKDLNIAQADLMQFLKDNNISSYFYLNAMKASEAGSAKKVKKKFSAVDYLAQKSKSSSKASSRINSHPSSGLSSHPSSNLGSNLHSPLYMSPSNSTKGSLANLPKI